MRKILTIIKIIIFAFSNPLLAIIQQVLIKLKIITYPPTPLWSLLILVLPVYLFILYQKTQDKFRGNLFGFLNSAVSNAAFFWQISLAAIVMVMSYLLIYTDIVPRTNTFGILLLFLNIFLIAIPGYLFLIRDNRKTTAVK